MSSGVHVFRLNNNLNYLNQEFWQLVIPTDRDYSFRRTCLTLELCAIWWHTLQFLMQFMLTHLKSHGLWGLPCSWRLICVPQKHGIVHHYQCSVAPCKSLEVHIALARRCLRFKLFHHKTIALLAPEESSALFQPSFCTQLKVLTRNVIKPQKYLHSTVSLDTVSATYFQELHEPRTTPLWWWYTCNWPQSLTYTLFLPSEASMPIADLSFSVAQYLHWPWE